MDAKTLTKHKWFWAWNDDREEAWLGRMAQEGWHLSSLGMPGEYTFVAGEPREDIYRLDYFINRKDYEYYLQLFRDAGWEHIGEMGGWQYFKTLKKGSRVPEIYTDNASKQQKYARLILFLIIFLPIFIMLATRPVPAGSHFYDLYSIVKMFFALILILYAYAIVRIGIRILHLRKK